MLPFQLRRALAACAASAALGCGARTSLPDGTPPEPEPPRRPGAPSFVWSQRFGSSGADRGLAVAVDAAGNIFVTGEITGPVDFGGGPIASPGVAGTSVFVAKLDPDGHILWSKAFGGEGSGRGIAADHQGNVVVVGDFSGQLDFGGGPLAASTSGGIFIAKLDGAGGHLWSKRFGDLTSDPNDTERYGGHAVAIDPADNIVFSGFFDGIADFGGGPIASANKPRIAVVELDPGGGHRWSHGFGYGDPTEEYTVATDAAGNVLLAGTFRTKVSFGGPVLDGTGLSDAFVAKLDPSGQHVYSRRFGGDSWTRALGVAAGADGEAWVTGSLEGSMAIGSTPLTTAGYEDVFLARLDAGGEPLSARRFGSDHDDAGMAITAGPAGEVLTTGYFEQGIDFGTGAHETGGAYDVFIARFAANGDAVAADTFGGVFDQIGASLAADATGAAVVTGWFDGSVDFGNGELETQGDEDIFLVKLPAP